MEIQQAPSSAATCLQRFLILGFLSHSGALSDHAPFHSKLPHGLRSWMRETW